MQGWMMQSCNGAGKTRKQLTWIGLRRLESASVERAWG